MAKVADHSSRTVLYAAHPLVREREEGEREERKFTGASNDPLGVEPADVAVTITLAGVPDGPVANGSQARRLAEAVQLCVDAG
jgi:hypothetical protein